MNKITTLPIIDYPTFVHRKMIAIQKSHRNRKHFRNLTLKLYNTLRLTGHTQKFIQHSKPVRYFKTYNRKAILETQNMKINISLL